MGALLQDSAALGVPLLEATHARAVIDLNRAEQEYDPAMIAGTLALPPVSSDRVRRGYGLFPRIAGSGQMIHSGRISAATAQDRLAALHRPWHGALQSALAAATARHGHAVLLDVHSMPSLEGAAPAQLVLGDRRGESAAPALVDWLESAFATRGLKIARNDPYAGGHTTAHHGRPAQGIHVVQLEFDRALYMDPATLKPHPGFAGLAANIAQVISELLTELPGLGLSAPVRLAAE